MLDPMIVTARVRIGEGIKQAAGSEVLLYRHGQGRKRGLRPLLQFGWIEWSNFATGCHRLTGWTDT